MAQPVNRPISPGYVTNPATDLTTPLRTGLLGDTMPIDTYQVTPPLADTTTLPAGADPIRAHPVDLAPATRTRRPQRPVRDHRAETSWWAVAAGLAVSHAAVLVLGVVLSVVLDWS